MKRKALLFSNTYKLDTISKKDIENITAFLKSDEGGAWNDDEIEPLQDIAADDLFRVLDKVKAESNDLVWVYFTGHGGKRGVNVIELNPKHEIIELKSFNGLALRQLNIYDCCRSEVNSPIDICIGVGKKKRKNFGVDERDKVRKEYESLVMDASPQTVCLYSCSDKEVSSFNSDGSYYTQCLISSAKSLLSTSDVVRVYDCHATAAPATTAMAKNERNLEQHPEIEPAKCLSCQELPVSFNPTTNNH